MGFFISSCVSGSSGSVLRGLEQTATSPALFLPLRSGSCFPILRLSSRFELKILPPDSPPKHPDWILCLRSGLCSASHPMTPTPGLPPPPCRRFSPRSRTVVSTSLTWSLSRVCSRDRRASLVLVFLAESQALYCRPWPGSPGAVAHSWLSLGRPAGRKARGCHLPPEALVLLFSGLFSIQAGHRACS